jgi:hypothetical protein
MTGLWIVLAAVVLLWLLGSIAVYLYLSRDPSRTEGTVIANLEDDTSADETGAVRSVQRADLYLPSATLTEIWSPTNLERLARTYWRFLSRVTLRLIRIVYTERERFVVLVFPFLKLLTFKAPEYEMDATRGIVRWRIERGLLVARRGKHGGGYLQIDVRRVPSHAEGMERLRVEVEVASFYPALAFGISRWFYNQTQSRIHVIVTYGFLRSLARLDLQTMPVSRVGRFPENLTVDDVPDPPPDETGPAPPARDGRGVTEPARP